MIRSTGQNTAARQRLLIIGAGMATAYLLQELGGTDWDMDITVIGDEVDACYNRVLLSNVLAGQSSEDDLPMLESDVTSQAVDFLSGTRVESVDLDRRVLVTDCGRVLAWDRLVFATGATVNQPSIANSDVRGVEQLRTLADARHLRGLAGSGGHAVVVGGGLLGLEAAHGLNTLGFTTTVLHRQSWIMNRQLDLEGGRLLQLKLEASGIRFRLERSVAALQTTAETLSGIALHGGESLPCQLLLFATGIKPNAQLAKAAGLTVESGILIDGQMRTSQPGVFALGECSQLGEDCFGLVAPIREQARLLALQLRGVPVTAFSDERWPTQLKISGVEIFSAGHVGGAAEQLVLRDESVGVYRRLVLRDERLVGAVLVGDKRGGTWYSELIRSGTDISGFRSGLLFGREVSEAMQLNARAA